MNQRDVQMIISVQIENFIRGYMCSIDEIIFVGRSDHFNLDGSNSLKIAYSALFSLFESKCRIFNMTVITFYSLKRINPLVLRWYFPIFQVVDIHTFELTFSSELYQRIWIMWNADAPIKITNLWKTPLNNLKCWRKYLCFWDIGTREAPNLI